MHDEHSQENIGRMLEHAMNSSVALRGIDNPQAWVEKAKRCIAYVETLAAAHSPSRMQKAEAAVEACRGCTNSGSVADAEAEHSAAWSAYAAWLVLNTPARSETANQPQDATAGGDLT